VSIETLREKLSKVARDIGDVHDVANRRTDPDRETRLMLARMTQWRQALLEIDDAILAHLQPSPDLRGLVEQWLTDEELIDLSGPKTRKPTHGRCCTCQDCGFSHDDCECDRNERTVRWRAFIEAALATTPEPK
jgi:hypothetical protein